MPSCDQTGTPPGLDGFRQQADIGVTDAIVVPWRAYGVGFDGDLRAKQDGLRRFADEVISKIPNS